MNIVHEWSPILMRIIAVKFYPAVIPYLFSFFGTNCFVSAPENVDFHYFGDKTVLF